MALRSPTISRAIQALQQRRNSLFRTTRQIVFQTTTPLLQGDDFRIMHDREEHTTIRFFSSTTTASAAPDNNNNIKGKKRRKYIPRKAAVELTEQARTFFKKLLKANPEKAGIMLHYQQATSGQPRMVFSFDFVTKDGLGQSEEGISLEINEDGTPKSPEEALVDGKQKLHISSNAFLKVLGAKVDIDMENITPILYDKEGNQMDPNA